MEKSEIFNKIILDINKELESICDEGRMEYHIIPVVNNAKKLAKKLNADIEAVEIAAYLHDITRIKGDVDTHHITGAEYAREFLCKYNYPEEKIKLIQKCIKNHRGSVEIPRETIEEKIISTADAMAHIQYPLPLFHKWYGKKQCDLKDGASEIKSKLQRSWKKIEFKEAKEELENKYKFLMEVLTNE